MYGKISALLVAIVALSALPGCYESPNASLHKPGVYKGPKDPLLEKQRNLQHQTALRERFDHGQRDR